MASHCLFPSLPSILTLNCFKSPLVPMYDWPNGSFSHTKTNLPYLMLPKYCLFTARNFVFYLGTKTFLLIMSNKNRSSVMSEKDCPRF